jgi:predicted MPP superfamily phosphohydrolase
VIASPLIATGYGVFVQRDNFRVREVKVHIPRLRKELDGLKIVQLSDIHLSPFLSERELARTIDMANETKAHIAVVTGDLITGYRDPLDACIRQLGRLRADAGVIGCLGNHETYARVERYTTEQAARFGVRFLRQQSEVIEFGGNPINFAGVDYQPLRSEYLADAGDLIQLGMPNVLLSHNPDVFPIARQKGFDLTLSGHTHGGQITFELLNQNVSIARFYTPYVYGLYEEGGASAYVTRGIGTVGVPARLGAPPEVSLIRLCAI